MNFLDRLLGKDNSFFDLLEASAQEARNSAVLLEQMLPKAGNDRAFEEAMSLLSDSRRKHKRISQEITQHLCRTFVTPLEREDIEALSNSLWRVPKTVEKIAERLMICPLNAQAEGVGKLVIMLEASVATVCRMVEKLRKNPHVEEIQDDYAKLQSIEGDADKFLMLMLRELFQGDVMPKDVIFLKDIFELLERAIDRCRDAGNVVFQVVLKYS